MNFPFSFRTLAIESLGAPVRPHQRTVESLGKIVVRCGPSVMDIK